MVNEVAISRVGFVPMVKLFIAGSIAVMIAYAAMYLFAVSPYIIRVIGQIF